MERNCTRRGFLLSAAATPLAAQQRKTTFPSEVKRYEDPTTELDVYRLTDPAHSSTLPAYYNRAVAHNSASLIFSSDRNGSPQAYRMDLKNGETRELSDATDLDGYSLTLTPDNRWFCYFAGRRLFMSTMAGRARALYEVPEGWERCPGLTVGPDGTHATFAERQGEKSRLQMVPLVQGPARTVVEVPFAMSDPIPRPMRAQILFRQGDQALWMVNADGTQKRPLKLAPGRIGPANWAADGKSLLYLSFPADPMQIVTIRECVPDTNGDIAHHPDHAALHPPGTDALRTQGQPSGNDSTALFPRYPAPLLSERPGRQTGYLRFTYGAVSGEDRAGDRLVRVERATDFPFRGRS